MNVPPLPLAERIDQVRGRAVRALVAEPAGGTDTPAEVVLVPGLGALGYLLPTVRAVAARGVRCVLLDLPGFGSGRPRPSSPTVPGIAEVVADWWVAHPAAGRRVLAGHSTGAQAALAAALMLQRHDPPAGVVLAGPTVAPRQRRLWRMVAMGPAAYRGDSLRELVSLPDYLRAGPALITLLRSAIADAPELAVADLRAPILVTAGRRDAFVPDAWLTRLALAAERSPRVRAVRLPGSHNNPYTAPGPLSALLVTMIPDADPAAR